MPEKEKKEGYEVEELARKVKCNHCGKWYFVYFNKCPFCKKD